MPKIIAAINTTLDGVFDHTAVPADAELHQHYADLLRQADTLLYGRITYQLMEYWKSVVENPTGEQATDDFAVLMDQLPKVVFSRTLQHTDWKSARLAHQSLEAEVLALKPQPGNPILVGSRSLIVSLLPLGLIDELQLCIHPIIAGNGQKLFEGVTDTVNFKLLKSKTLGSGAIVLYYEPNR